MRFTGLGSLSAKHITQVAIVIISLLDDALVVALSRINLHIPGLRLIAFSLLAYMLFQWAKHLFHYVQRNLSNRKVFKELPTEI